MNDSLERLERHIIEMPEDGCWITDLAPNPRHGYVSIGTNDRRVKLIHRLAWEAHNAEPIPEGMVVMHSCDNRACCNPAHLSVGTQQDNMRDAARKGRCHCGSKPDVSKRKRDDKGRFI